MLSSSESFKEAQRLESRPVSFGLEMGSVQYVFREKDGAYYTRLQDIVFLNADGNSFSLIELYPYDIEIQFIHPTGDGPDAYYVSVVDGQRERIVMPSLKNGFDLYALLHELGHFSQANTEAYFTVIGLRYALVTTYSYSKTNDFLEKLEPFRGSPYPSINNSVEGIIRLKLEHDVIDTAVDPGKKRDLANRLRKEMKVFRLQLALILERDATKRALLVARYLRDKQAVVIDSSGEGEKFLSHALKTRGEVSCVNPIDPILQSHESIAI